LSLVTRVPTPSLYIDREGGGVVTILVKSKESVLNYIQKLLSIGIRLVWPIVLGFSVVDATPLLALVCGLGKGPWLVVTSLGNPVGHTSIIPQAFHGSTWRLPYFSGYAWWIRLVSGPFDAKPWSGPVLKKSFKWCVLFQRKRALTECSPRAYCYLEQKVRGSSTLIVEKTKKLFLGYVPCSPRASFWVLFDRQELR
jgi:hypothetical protein